MVSFPSSSHFIWLSATRFRQNRCMPLCQVYKWGQSVSLVTSLKTKVDLDSRFNHNQYYEWVKSNRKYYYFRGFQIFFFFTMIHNKKYIMEQTYETTLRTQPKHVSQNSTYLLQLMHSDIFLFGFNLFYAMQLKRNVLLWSY